MQKTIMVGRRWSGGTTGVGCGASSASAPIHNGRSITPSEERPTLLAHYPHTLTLDAPVQLPAAVVLLEEGDEIGEEAHVSGSLYRPLVR